MQMKETDYVYQIRAAFCIRWVFVNDENKNGILAEIHSIMECIQKVKLKMNIQMCKWSLKPDFVEMIIYILFFYPSTKFSYYTTIIMSFDSEQGSNKTNTKH